MKIVLASLIALVIAVVGVIGFVVVKHDAVPSSLPPGTSLGPPADAAGGAAVATISHGEPVRLEDHCAAGVRTVFYFYADW